MPDQKKLNPYRHCCLNCTHWDEGCVRIFGVKIFKPHPRHQNRCGYFNNRDRRFRGK